MNDINDDTSRLLFAYRDGKISRSDVLRSLYEIGGRYRRSPLSEGQKGLWWLQKTSASSSVYNIALCSRLDGRVESGLLEQALSLVVKRHPVLTGVICEENGVPYQQSRPGRRLSLAQEDISALDDEAVIPYLKELAKAPFLLAEGPLLRAHLLRRRADE
ncbi:MULTISPECIES: condensation domain-containing protein, partial [unclassified Bradyrhizobium]|uniref:condensation domain-containing protein n=1 Tax=unclassified Bradyrhizobium TaxID=2631580 RepID=UPI0029164BBE